MPNTGAARLRFALSMKIKNKRENDPLYESVWGRVSDPPADEFEFGQYRGLRMTRWKR